MNQSYIKRLEKLNKNNLKGKSGLGTLELATEWIKWLSYEPKHEIDKINSIYAKKTEELTIEELHTLITYKERKEMIDLIKKYQAATCNEEEYLKVFNFINKPITDVMFEKLTKKELNEAKTKTISVDSLSKEQLKNMKENYNDLNMVDAYILHIALDYAFVKNLGSVNKKR